MKNMKQTIELAIYGYTPGEFLPVYYEGKIANRDQFIAYKAKKVGIRMLKAADRAYYRIAGQ